MPIQLKFEKKVFGANSKSTNDSFSESKEPKRTKLSSVYALTPSLRIGRRSENTYAKRRIGKMVSFPRIGRGDSTNYDESNYGAKRPGSGSGMWFGPRLGRVQKRNSDDYTPWTYIILNGEGPVSRQVYTPRLGRESEEIYDDLGSDVDVLA
ncbi:hypothetical protein BDFB_002005 [Asbolus verrucosus]|uniref:Uncharacterized protein n=1 Tax=Asbolus verrucosus TaxID=1661398 RepID=A0A482VIG7_ASBVE|nr:hypothetical protein BDFB_002005 [Asbolus verrucosus]